MFKFTYFEIIFDDEMNEIRLRIGIGIDIDMSLNRTVID